MTGTLLLLIVTMALAVLGWYTVRYVQRDGYGSPTHRPPASHHDPFDTGCPA